MHGIGWKQSERLLETPKHAVEDKGDVRAGQNPTCSV